MPLGDMACQKILLPERPKGAWSVQFCIRRISGSAPSNIITELLRGAMFRKYDSQEVDDITSAELAHNILARTDVEVARRFLA